MNSALNTRNYASKTSNFELKTRNYVSKTRNLVLKTRNSVSKTRTFVSKTRNYVSKTRTFVSKTRNSVSKRGLLYQKRGILQISTTWTRGWARLSLFQTLTCRGAGRRTARTTSTVWRPSQSWLARATAWCSGAMCGTAAARTRPTAPATWSRYLLKLKVVHLHRYSSAFPHTRTRLTCILTCTRLQCASTAQCTFA